MLIQEQNININEENVKIIQSGQQNNEEEDLNAKTSGQCQEDIE